MLPSVQPPALTEPRSGSEDQEVARLSPKALVLPTAAHAHSPLTYKRNHRRQAPLRPRRRYRRKGPQRPGQADKPRTGPPSQKALRPLAALQQGVRRRRRARPRHPQGRAEVTGCRDGPRGRGRGRGGSGGRRPLG